MNLRDLQYLQALSEHLNFHKAAEACFVSQPTLSTQIKKLEQTLGVALLERNPGGLRFTHIGEQVLSDAKQILMLAGNIKKTALENQNLFSSSINIGFIPTISPYLLPKISTPLRQTFPALNIRLHEYQTSLLLKKLEDGSLDVLVMALPVDDNVKMFECIDLFSEDYFLCVHKSHELVKQKAVEKKDLKKIKISLLENGHCLRDHVKDLCHLTGAKIDTSFTATSLETLRHMVAVNELITLVPEMAVDQSKQKNSTVRYLPLKENKLQRKIVMLHRKNSFQAEVFEAIAQMLQKLFKSK